MSQLSLQLRSTFFALMRGIMPVWKKGDQVWVFRDEDVREILARDKDFTLRPVNQEKVERRVGRFLLSMDDSPQYQHEIGVMRSVVNREDVKRIKDFVRNRSQEIIQSWQGKQEVNIVRDFFRQGPLDLLDSYFGTPTDDAETTLRWHRILFWDIFLNLKNEASIIQEAEAVAPQFNAYLDGLIEDLKTRHTNGEVLPDTILSRLVQLQGGEAPFLDDDAIRRNMAGTILGAEETMATACGRMLNQIWVRPEIRKKVQEAARAQDVETVSKYAFEAFRLHPNLPVILRWSEADVVLGSGRKVPKDKIVYAFIASAMLDKRKFPHPKDFLMDRSFGDYLFMGHGLHKCFGKYVVAAVIPEMLTALCRQTDFQPAGKIEWEGPFADKWMWERV